MEKFVFKNNDPGGYSDLATERRRADLSVEGISFRKDRAEFGFWERITVLGKKAEEAIGRPEGIYDTLNLPRMAHLDVDEIEDAANEVAKELCRICDKKSIIPERILVVGIGNQDLTADSVGPRSADEVEATLHILKEDRDLFYSLECSEIAVIKPGVKSASGLDAHDIVQSVSTRLHPDLIIAVDSLAARDPARIGTTVQICDTGIHPGSGIGNQRCGITPQTLGVPVIAIGVPTVINSRMFVVENGEARALKKEEGMFIAPYEIGELVKNAARIIGGGINQAFGLGA